MGRGQCSSIHPKDQPLKQRRRLRPVLVGAHTRADLQHGMRAVPYQGVPVATIKRFVTGKGNADKAKMVAAIQARGFAPADDNEADAIALLLWATDPQGGRA
jgi:Holliday junction resolvasome RuvABC endonuclease subunit